MPWAPSPSTPAMWATRLRPTTLPWRSTASPFPSWAPLAPQLVSSDVPGADGFDVSKVFDGNIGTNSTIAGMPKAGNKIVFDLGQNRTINTFEYFIPRPARTSSATA